MAARKNPPLVVRDFGSAKGHRMSRNVLAVEYRHEQSAKRTPFRHDFEIDGIELWALRDGSLLIRHPSRRLWDDFTVEDGE